MSHSDSSLQQAYAQGFSPVTPGRLPVFMCGGAEYSIFYAPRFVCVLPQSLVSDARQHIAHLAGSSQTRRLQSTPVPTTAGQAASRIVDAARRAVDEAGNLSCAAFSPECLTLFLNNACNLNCRYCHAAPGTEPNRPITDDAIRAAVQLVAASCAHGNRPLTVAFHGGGEPSLDESRVDRILDIVRKEAGSSGVLLRTYIATNGVMPESRARWLARRFDLVGLSCDGPPDVQDRQRPGRDGRSTSPSVERTAAILRQTGSPFLVRATITRETIGRQADIMSYFIEQFAPVEVRLEPVYVDAMGAVELSQGDAALFLSGFMSARKLAKAHHVQLTTSLALPESLHGRHCNVLRKVLNLAPGDIATGCFLESWESGIARRQVCLGSVNPESGRFQLHEDRMASQLRLSSTPPDGCRDCLCCFQCSHGCPDVCVLKTLAGPTRKDDPVGGFRCQASQLLMNALIREAADVAWTQTPPGVCQDVLVSKMRLPVAVYREPGRGGTSP